MCGVFVVWTLLMKLRIDLADAHLLKRFNWYLSGVPGRQYVTCGDPDNKGKTIPLHRLILQPSDDVLVDHINGDCFDNRRRNLRTCTHAENMRNRKMHKNNGNGFPNVWRDNRPNRKTPFVAEVAVNGIKHRKRGFASAEDAYECAKQMLVELHGEFNKLHRFQA